MATESTGFDRFNDALRNLDDQMQDLREQFDDRRKDIEKEVRQRADDVQSQLRKSPLYRRAEQVRKDWEEQISSARSSVYDVFGLATKSDIDKLNKKLNTISRKLTDLAKEAKDQIEV